MLGVVDAWEPVPERVSDGVRGRSRVGRRVDEGVPVADCDSSENVSMKLQCEWVRRGETPTFASERSERTEEE